MLKKSQRLSRSEFELLLKRGRRVQGAHLTLVVRTAPAPSCGVVVSKKTAKRAHARNLLRRRIFSILKDEFGALSGCHVAVIARPNAPLLSFGDLREELVALLRGIS